MHNLAHRHRRAALKAGRALPELRDYAIQDSDYRPDLRGEFAGVKLVRRGGTHVVRLSSDAARFYLDSGSIRLLEGPGAEASVSVRKQGRSAE